jgi:hypothetical protein
MSYVDLSRIWKPVDIPMGEFVREWHNFDGSRTKEPFRVEKTYAHRDWLKMYSKERVE